MKYISTRAKSAPVSPAMAIKRGIAEDGGLYIPEYIPTVDAVFIRRMIDMSYAERAASVMELFIGEDYSYDELLTDCNAAYGSGFDAAGPAPVVAVNDRLSILELWHGPTAAFKDMALQVMPRLLVRALKKTGERRRALILVATSGDTGKAALEGYRDIDGTSIMVFYPQKGVSRVQKLQMATQEGENVFVQSVCGNFDDAQSGVKAIFADKSVAAQLDARGCFLSSANSINWGRLVPQIAYYASACCDLIASGKLADGQLLDICVPTGNFGNILAAYYARCAGFPINRLICASNSNRVLTDFFDTGEYNSRRPLLLTDSPSMDILISSNLERLISLEFGSGRCAELMEMLSRDGKYRITEDELLRLRAVFTAFCCDGEMADGVITEMLTRYNYLCDTHTACGLYAAERCLEQNGADAPLLCVSTASAFKFSPAVCRAAKIQYNGDFDASAALSAATGVPVPSPLTGLAEKQVRFDPDIPVKADLMKDAVLGCPVI